VRITQLLRYTGLNSVRDILSFLFLSEVALTYACNIKCRFCYAGCTKVKKNRELDKEGFKKVLDIIRYEAEVPSVSFTGGEPLLNKNLPELIKYASKANGMRVNLITNGTLITTQKSKRACQGRSCVGAGEY